MLCVSLCVHVLDWEWEAERQITAECVVTRPCLYMCETEIEGESLKKTQREEGKICRGKIRNTESKGRSRKRAQRQPSTEAYGSDGDNTHQWATTQPVYCSWRQAGQPEGCHWKEPSDFVWCLCGCFSALVAGQNSGTKINPCKGNNGQCSNLMLVGHRLAEFGSNGN